MSEPVRLCHRDDLVVGSARGFDPAGTGTDTVFAVRDRHGIRVFRNACPHEGTPLGWRKDAFLSPDDTAIMCYAHGARFDLVSGLCFTGPCIGKTLILLPSSVDENGYLVLQIYKTPVL